MKKTIGLLLFFLFSLNISQSRNFLLNNFQISLFNENSINNNLLLKDTSIYKKNLFSHDFDLLAYSFAYARKIKMSNWYIGGRSGFGMSFLSLISGIYFPNAIGLIEWRLSYGSIYKIMHTEIFCYYILSEKILFDGGIQLGYFTWGGEGENDPLYGVLGGVYFSPMFGWRKFKIGTCIFIAPFIFYSPILIFRYII